ncbi:hypothetical protein BJY24_004633 [Nocardia transvalensis]|uniref:DUF8017 domain-containing protein n=1 Tax=Nocardia transvalensis TaxID=37333 RepID=A0A7W9UJU2_9NOCA|nr:hypothetical protein [Nocardia transvalensis]MBB5915721.1 hypothetical protein [Nocardia transvalensis]
MTDDRQWWNQPEYGPGQYSPEQQQPTVHRQDFPPQGMPPHGVPPQGMPPQGVPQQPYEYPPLDSQQPQGQYPPPPYGAPPYGAPSQPYGAPPPRNTNTGMIVALVVAVVVVVAAVAGAAVFLRGSSSDDTSAAATSTRTSTAAAQATSAPPTTETTAPSPSTKAGSTTTAVIPGFQGVAVPSRGVAYDVPAGWKVDSESMIRGFEDGGNRISGTGTTVDGQNYCPSSNRTTTFVSRSDKPDPATAATDVGSMSAQYGFNKPPDATATPPAPITTTGGIAGQMVETSGSWHPDDPACTTTRFSVYTFAFPGPQNPMLVLTIASDRGVPGEVTPDLAAQIFTSIRKL